MAPLVMPITSCEVNCAGSCTACTPSATNSTATSTTPMRELQLEVLMPSIRTLERGFAASPVVMSVLRKGAGGRRRPAHQL